MKLVPCAVALSVVVAFVSPARADPPPDESVLGSVDVTGAAGGVYHAPPPKMALLPVLTRSNQDTLVQLVTRRDIDLSGQWEVVDDAVLPSGPWQRDTPIVWKDWRDKKEAKGIEIVVRVWADPDATGTKVQMFAEAYLVPPEPKDDKKPDPKVPPKEERPEPPATPVFKTKVEGPASRARLTAHRLVDALLGGLTGRPGGFASHMVYTGKVGRWRQPFVIESDGAKIEPYGPANATALSPVFGPGGEVFYALSENFHRFQLVQGAKAIPVPMTFTGSLMGISFSPDKQKLAYAMMQDGASVVYLADPTGAASRAISKEPLASQPAFGPLGKVAYAAGLGAQRIYVDGKPISPGGFLASAPAFCDTPSGLYVLFTVGVGAGADIIAVDTAGGGIRRLTEKMGSNTYPACSPDGRLVSFFSTTRAGKGPGLYIVPIARPWLPKKISDEVGESLRWEAIAGP